MQLPHVTDAICRKFNDIYKVSTLKQLGSLLSTKRDESLSRIFSISNQRNEFNKVLTNLPVLEDIQVTIKKVSGDEDSKQTTELATTGETDTGSSIFVASRPNEDLELHISTFNKNKQSSGDVYCPRYHKSKTVSWWLVLGCSDGELVAMKRIGTINKQPSSHTLLFTGPTEIGEKSSYIVFLIPDSVYGIEVFGRFDITL